MHLTILSIRGATGVVCTISLYTTATFLSDTQLCQSQYLLRTMTLVSDTNSLGISWESILWLRKIHLKTSEWRQVLVLFRSQRHCQVPSGLTLDVFRTSNEISRQLLFVQASVMSTLCIVILLITIEFECVISFVNGLQ